MEPVAYQQVVATPFSLRDSPCRTTVWDAGALESDAEQAGLRLPANYRASCQRLLGFGPAASMETAACPKRGGLTCTVTLEHSGQQFAGSNPTAAMVAAALAQGCNRYVNGVKAFGLTNPAVQRKLQQDSTKASAGSSVSTATADSGYEVAGMAAGSCSAAEADGQQACYPPAAARATKHPQVDDQLPVAGAAAAAAAAAEPSAFAQAILAMTADAAAAPQRCSPSVLVQTATLPPLQLRQQATAQHGKQDTLQQRVVQTGATVASPNEATAGPNAANAGSRSPLPPIATGQTPSPRMQAAAPSTLVARPTPTPPPRVCTPLSAKAPIGPIGLFKPSPSRCVVPPLPAAKLPDRPGRAASPAPDVMQYAAQQLHSGGGAPAAHPGGPSAAATPSSAFTRFNATSHMPPAFLRGHQQQPPALSPFIAARSVVPPPASLAASAAASAALVGYPLPQLNVPSWSGSNVSSNSMLGARAFDGGSSHPGSLDASSFELRSLSNGSVGSLGSWAPLQRLSADSTGALRDYFGQLAAKTGNLWDPNNYTTAALAAFAHTARLSSSARGGASLRAVAAAATDAAYQDAGTPAGGLTAAAGIAEDIAAGPLAKKRRRTAPAVRQPDASEAAAAGDSAEGTLERRPSPQGRLTPEALSQGAAAAEAALSSQGLLNPSAATVKAPRVAAKGWTAFTAFGLHTRDAVRAANPGATSVEVEKLVGQLWGRLSKDEKQGWVQRAARARSARGSNGAVSGQARQKRKRPAAGVPDGAAPAAGATMDAAAVHRRKRSSRVRRPPMRTLSSGELAPHPGAPQGVPTAALGAAKPGTSPKHSGNPAGGFSSGGVAPQVSASRAAAELELEVGTLEVLASMQAAAADSHRSLAA